MREPLLAVGGLYLPGATTDPLRAISFLGTAFILDLGSRRWILVTARHVVDLPEVAGQPTVAAFDSAQDGELVLREIAAWSWPTSGADLAIAEIAPHPRLQGLEVAEPSSDLAINWDLISIEFSDSLNQELPTLSRSIRKGNIVRIRREVDGPLAGFRVIEASFPALVGASGAPMISSETAEVVGVVAANRARIVMPAQILTSLDADNTLLQEVQYHLPHAQGLHFDHLHEAIAEFTADRRPSSATERAT